MLRRRKGWLPAALPEAFPAFKLVFFCLKHLTFPGGAAQGDQGRFALRGCCRRRLKRTSGHSNAKVLHKSRTKILNKAGLHKSHQEIPTNKAGLQKSHPKFPRLKQGYTNPSWKFQRVKTRATQIPPQNSHKQTRATQSPPENSLNMATQRSLLQSHFILMQLLTNAFIKWEWNNNSLTQTQRSWSECPGVLLCTLGSSSWEQLMDFNLFIHLHQGITTSLNVSITRQIKAKSTSNNFNNLLHPQKPA